VGTSPAWHEADEGSRSESSSECDAREAGAGSTQALFYVESLLRKTAG
jgi:hypothetical protein